MDIRRLCLAAAVSVGLLMSAGGCGPRGGLVGRIDAALGRAGNFLVQKQSSDGAWRSQTYGCFLSGAAITPHVMSSLFFIPQANPAAREAFDRGVDFLVGFVGEDGQLRVAERELLFPVFAASAASRVVALAEKSPRTLRAQQAWLACLRRRQLTEQLGWSPADREYGGWGFSLETPRKRPPGRPQERFFESNMVATIYGLAALRSAKVPAHDPAYGQILLFACRCQNFPLEPDHADPHYDDGGFFFVPDEPVQNKAGIAGTDCHGRRRFHSYGTMTADGLRVLLRCGLEPDDPRLAAARNWLETHFSATVHPGIFARDREVLRDGVYYYWVMAVSHAFMGLGVEEIRTRSGKCRWAEQLAEAVLRRQNADGSWTNRYTDAKEDDPLVSTPYAAAGLAICRAMITGDYKHFARGFPDRMTILAPEVAAAKP